MACGLINSLSAIVIIARPDILVASNSVREHNLTGREEILMGVCT